MRLRGATKMSAPPSRAGLTLLLAFAASSLARAEEVVMPPGTPPGRSESCAAERFVVLRTSPELDAALMAEVRTDLATELEQRGLAVCAPEESAHAPAVVVDVRPLGSALVIELDDRLTHKRVARDLSLQNIPANGRALAVAIAIDELLRASWAELSLKSAAQPDSEGEQPTAPPRVQATRPVSARGKWGVWSPRPREIELGVALGYAHTKHDFDAFSLSARAALHPWERGWVELRLSGLGSLAASSPRGDVLARGLGGSLTAGACTGNAASARLFGCAGARGSIDWLRFRGVRPELAEARQRDSVVVYASAVALLALRLSQRLSLFVELAPGAVLRGAEATDGTRTLLGVTGFLLSTQLGLGVQL